MEKVKNDTFLFTSKRLGFRPWTTDDLEPMAAISADAEVMRHFPKVQDLEDTRGFIERMHTQYLNNGYCYFATEILESRTFIGFVGLCSISFEAKFTPCVDIGWRLHKDHWGKGYATEGAKACLDFGFDEIGLDKIYAVCPITNLPSENVMKKIGMTKHSLFKHPNLADYPLLEECYAYVIEKGHN